MADDLRISKSRAGLALPSDAVTRTFGIFGQKDSGKTTTARVLAEEVVKAGGHVVPVDPVGVWWGITRDGRGRGVKGIVIGGEHADVPLEKTGGQLVAELVVSRSYPAVVVDTKLLRKGHRMDFMADFLEAVYHLNRRPLHLFFEEADQALPQNPRFKHPNLGRVIGAAEDIVKLGRSRGLGTTVISQRFATVSANVREQVEALVLHGLVGPLDRKELRKWIEDYGSLEDVDKVLKSVLELPQGEAWVYSPRWLRLLEHVAVRAARTLDTSATPSDDERELEESAPRPAVDLEELREKMADTVKRAEANDPKKLQAELAQRDQKIGRLEPALEQALAAAEQLEAELQELRDNPKVEHVAVVPPETKQALRNAIERAEMIAGNAGDAVSAAKHALENLEGLEERAPEKPAPRGNGKAPGSAVSRIREEAFAAPTSAPPRSVGDGDPSIGGLKGQVLEAVAAFYPRALAKRQIAALTGKRIGGYFNNTLSELRTAGYMEGFEITEAGLAAIGGSKAPPSPQEMIAMFRSSLSGLAREIFDVIVNDYPNALTKQEIADRTGRQIAGYFNNALSEARGTGVIIRQGNANRASDDLFLVPA